jgi:hypothetical protein
MTRLLVVCEGLTEADFIRHCVAPHLAGLGIWTTTSLVGHRSGRKGGGNVNVERVADHLRLEYHNFDRLTTLLDLYGFTRARGRSRAELEAEILVRVCGESVDINQVRVLPYVQQYEFEGLLFSDVEKFEWVSDAWSPSSKAALLAVRRGFLTPEDINNSPQTAPSKRILQILGGRYSKTEHGPIIAAEIGLARIREQCPGFNEWVSRLEQWAPGA